MVKHHPPADFLTEYCRRRAVGGTVRLRGSTFELLPTLPAHCRSDWKTLGGLILSS